MAHIGKKGDELKEFCAFRVDRFHVGCFGEKNCPFKGEGCSWIDIAVRSWKDLRNEMRCYGVLTSLHELVKPEEEVAPSKMSVFFSDCGVLNFGREGEIVKRGLDSSWVMNTFKDMEREEEEEKSEGGKNTIHYKILKNSGKWVGCKNYQIDAIETYVKNIEVSEVETKYTNKSGASFSFVKGCDTMI
jgi:hypothetical protein